MKRLGIILSLCFCVLMISCKGTKNIEANTPKNDSAKTKYEKLADEMCGCSSEILVLLKELEEHTAAENTDAIMELMPKLEALFPDFESCIADMDRKYPEIDSSDEEQKKAMDALQKNCPDLYNLMEKEYAKENSN